MLIYQVYKTEHQRLVESVVLTNPLYEQWRGVGRLIAEQKMTEPEILDLFAKIETGATQAGSNRTVAGRAKDTTVKAFTNTRDAFNSVMSRIQDSTPVQAVDVAYDKATDSVANLVGGQKSQIMRAIVGYRNLVKQYPKAAGFSKAALIAIAGLATGGAGLPAIAGLTFALDSAIRGEKLSSVLGKGAGAAAVTWGVQQAAGMLGGTAQAAEPGTSVSTTSPLPGGTVTAQTGDTLSSLAAKSNVSVDEIMRLNPKITNPDVLAAGQVVQLPPVASGSAVYQGGVGTSADTMAKIGTGQYSDSAISQAMAKKVRESVQFKTLPADQLFDHKLTVMNWALNESTGQPRYSVHLTSAGTYTVFENVMRYAKAVVMEADTGPGRPDLPDEYRPDMPGGSGAYDKRRKGLVGRGLDWMDRATKKVGSALSTFGHQFTTKITKDKLKMNWHQAGKPSDSDALAAFLIKQGVPMAVLQDVYGAMKLPVPANMGAQEQQPWAGINPDTGKYWTTDELAALGAKKQPTAASVEQPKVEPTGPLPGEDPRGPNYVGRRELARRTSGAPALRSVTPVSYSASNVMPGLPAQKSSTTAPTAPTPAVAPTVAPAPVAASPNFSGPAGYGKTTMSFKTPAGPNVPVVSQPTVPTAAKPPVPAASSPAKPEAITIGGEKIKPTDPAYAKIMKNVPVQLVRPTATSETVARVRSMLEQVKSMRDVEAVKHYVEQQFRLVENNHSNQQQRRRLIERIMQIGSAKRRINTFENIKLTP